MNDEAKDANLDYNAGLLDYMKTLVTHDIKEQEAKEKNKIFKILALIIGVIAIIAVAVIGIHFLKKDSDSDESNNGLKFLSWKEAHDKAKEKLKEFTTEEKLSLLYGTQNMQKKTKEGGCVGMIDPIKGKFGGICLQDGPAGVRFSENTQSWQASINTASTFNKTLMFSLSNPGRSISSKYLSFFSLISVFIIFLSFLPKYSCLGKNSSPKKSSNKSKSLGTNIIYINFLS